MRLQTDIMKYSSKGILVCPKLQVINKIKELRLSQFLHYYSWLYDAEGKV